MKATAFILLVLFFPFYPLKLIANFPCENQQAAYTNAQNQYNTDGNMTIDLSSINKAEAEYNIQ